jgi:hypothetical protein
LMLSFADRELSMSNIVSRFDTECPMRHHRLTNTRWKHLPWSQSQERSGSGHDRLHHLH